MKVSHKSPNGRIEIIAEGETQKDIFRQLSSMQEVFEHEKCGQCQDTNIKFAIRNVESKKKNYEYFELHCQNFQCRARLAFGQNLEGGSLFPKRKDDDGNYLPYNGWTKYEGKREKDEVSS